MNEALQQAVADLLQRAVDGVDSAATFLSAELPDYVYQLLLWYGVKSGVGCLLGIAMLFVAYKLCVKAAKITAAYRNKESWALDYYGDATGTVVAGTAACYLGATILVVIAACSVDLVWLKIWLAPKVWLVDYATSLVK